MIEANNPEIDVDELMEKIRQEVAMRQLNSPANSTLSTSNFSGNSLYLTNIEALINNADFRAQVRTKWPDKYNRFPFNLSKKFHKLALKILEVIFRDQREVNFSVIQALKEYLVFNRQLIEQTTNLQAQMRLRDEYQTTVDNRLRDVDTRLAAIDERLNRLYNSITAIEQRLGEVDERLGAVDARLGGVDERLGAADARLGEIDERLGAADARLGGVDERLGVADARLGKVDECLRVVENRLSSVDERHTMDYSYVRNDLLQQKRLITLFLEEARQRLPEPFDREQLQTFVNEEPHLLDAFYVAFEDRFRGKREEIIDRLKVYLPIIQSKQVGTKDAPILDVGCGRGEWLELLAKSGYTASGIDVNRAMVEQCRSRNLNVTEADLISYLRTIPDASLGAVTGFHIIEHLGLPTLIKALAEIVRVLKPQGITILETPNPKNLVVGACNFYSDPTHQNPIFPETIQLVLESQGLANVQIMYLNPVQEYCPDNLGSQTLHNWFFGPRDYAVVGNKV